MQANNKLCHSKRDLFPQSFLPPSLSFCSPPVSMFVVFISMASNFSTIFVHKFELGFISFYFLLRYCCCFALFMLHEQHLFMFHFYHHVNEMGLFFVGASKTPTFFLYFDFSLIYTHIKLYFATIKFGDKFYIRVAYKIKIHKNIMLCSAQSNTDTNTNKQPPTVIFPGGEFFSLTFLIFLLFFFGHNPLRITQIKSPIVCCHQFPNFFSIIFVIVWLENLLLFCSGG